MKPGNAVSTGGLLKKGDVPGAGSDDCDASTWIKCLSTNPYPEVHTHTDPPRVSNQLATVYFRYVHPFHPSLDQQSFEAATRSPGLPDLLRQNKAWSVLYHSVLALGCQYDGGGSFEPGKGRAWSLFSTSLALFPDLLTLPDSLTILQALAAMTVYAFGISCISIEHVIVSEGARRAQNLARANLTGSSAHTFRKTFWVLYSMEKVSSFYFGRSSVRMMIMIIFQVTRSPTLSLLC